jgi:hypothetical protein
LLAIYAVKKLNASSDKSLYAAQEENIYHTNLHKVGSKQRLLEHAVSKSKRLS